MFKKAAQLKIRRMHLSHLCTDFEIISVGLRYIDKRPVVSIFLYCLLYYKISTEHMNVRLANWNCYILLYNFFMISVGFVHF